MKKKKNCYCFTIYKDSNCGMIMSFYELQNQRSYSFSEPTPIRITMAPSIFLYWDILIGFLFFSLSSSIIQLYRQYEVIGFLDSFILGGSSQAIYSKDSTGRLNAP